MIYTTLSDPGFWECMVIRGRGGGSARSPEIRPKPLKSRKIIIILKAYINGARSQELKYLAPKIKSQKSMKFVKENPGDWFSDGRHAA